MVNSVTAIFKCSNSRFKLGHTKPFLQPLSPLEWFMTVGRVHCLAGWKRQLEVSLHAWLPLDPTQVLGPWALSRNAQVHLGQRQEADRKVADNSRWLFPTPRTGALDSGSLGSSTGHLSRCLVGHYWSKIQWTRLQGGISSSHQHSSHIHFLSDSPLHTSWVNFLLIVLKYNLHIVQLD